MSSCTNAMVITKHVDMTAFVCDLVTPGIAGQ